MTPVKIYMPLPATVSSSALVGLLNAAGLTAKSETEWIAECPDGDSKPVMLVIVGSDDSDPLQAAVRSAAGRGDRVIGVWPPGAGSVIPASLADFGSALVAWDAAALQAAICGKVLEWQDAGGGRRDAPPPSRNSNC
jgi:hypothetical protein